MSHDGSPTDDVSSGPPRSAALDGAETEIATFLRERVDVAGVDGVVVTLNGGVTSTLTATLAVDALGADSVYGLILPCNLGREADALDAAAVVESLGIDHSRVHLQPLLTAFVDRVPPQIPTRDETVALDDVVARLRMTCAYFVANTTSALVLGTADRTALLLGTVTRHGDGGADAFPLAGLYRTEVRALARRLDVPEFVVEKPARSGVRGGRSGAADLDAEPGTVDRVLHRLAVHDFGIQRTAEEVGVDADLVRRVARRHAATRHERRPALTPARRDGRPRAGYFYDLELRLPGPSG